MEDNLTGTYRCGSADYALHYEEYKGAVIITLTNKLYKTTLHWNLSFSQECKFSPLHPQVNLY